MLKVIFRKTVLTNGRFLAPSSLSHIAGRVHKNRVPWEDVESDDDDELATNGSEVSTTIKIQALPSPSTARAFGPPSYLDISTTASTKKACSSKTVCGSDMMDVCSAICVLHRLHIRSLL